MPGVDRLSLDLLLREVDELQNLGVPAVALFPCVDISFKTADGAEACYPEGLIPRAVRAIKSKFPDIGIICDGALDPYTTHGQDGMVDDKCYVLNDETVSALCQQAQINAEAALISLHHPT